MKQKLTSLILHPVFITSVVSLIIISILPDFFNKYEVTEGTKRDNSRENRTFFEDLNNDGVSERIMFYDNQKGNAAYEVHDAGSNLLDQWNFQCRRISPYNTGRLFFNDYDDNELKEVYFLGSREDSVFLFRHEPYAQQPESLAPIFIEKLLNYDVTDPLYGKMFTIKDADSNGDKELFLTISRGFKGNPRHAYSVNLRTQRVNRSEHLTNQSYITDIRDLDGDGKHEIVFSNYAAGNELDTAITKRSDYHSWINVLNSDLTHKFPSLEIKNPFSSSYAITVLNDKKGFDVIVLSKSKRPREWPNKLLKLDSNGQLLKELNLREGDHRIVQDDDSKSFHLINRHLGIVRHMDADLNILKEVSLSKEISVFPLDFNNDGRPEWLIRPWNGGQWSILDENFEHEVKFDYGFDDTSTVLASVFSLSSIKQGLFIQQKKNWITYDYSENPMYLLRHLIYLGIIGVVGTIVWLTRKGQQIRMERKREIEKKIAELQIKSIKNQVDPHFVFNAINTISEMTLVDNKLEADRFICRFSDFMRVTLENSDKIVTTLQEEIDFVENFINLQQIRFQNSFDYMIDIAPQINMNSYVPKQVLFTYIENAIKHGLQGVQHQGKLKISLKKNGKGLIFTVDDNGSGFSYKNRSDSTGNGLRIMEDLFQLYRKLHKKIIKHELKEILSEKGEIIGMRATISIS